MADIDWGGFANNALNASLGLWAAQEQAKLGYGTQVMPHQQAAITNTAEKDNAVGKQTSVGASTVPWYQRRSVQVVGGVVVVAGVLYAALRKRGKR